MSLHVSPKKSTYSSPLFEFVRSESGSREFPSIPHTPLSQSFNVLIHGNFSPNTLKTLEMNFSSSSPKTKIELEEVFHLSDGELSKPTVSRPLVVKVDMQKVAIFKPRQREPGSKAWIARNPQVMSPKYYCHAGSGAFMEVLCSLFINRCMELIPEVKDHVLIPKVAYVQMGHPSIYLHKKPFTSPLSDLSSPVVAYPRCPNNSVKGTGSLHEFIENTTICSLEIFKCKPQIVQEFIATMHMLLLNSDAHIGNILVTLDQKLVMIDHAFTLSEEGRHGGAFFWLSNKNFSNPMSVEIQDFLNCLNRGSLKEIYDELYTTLEDTCDEELENLQELRLLGYEIVLIFLKEGAKAQLSILDLANALCQKSPFSYGGVVYEIFQELKNSKEDNDTVITEYCKKKIERIKNPPMEVTEFIQF